MTEREKMLRSELYNAADPELSALRLRARKMVHRYNNSRPGQHGLRQRILEKLLGKTGEDPYFEAPFRCDYGGNIYLGDQVYFNFNAILLDVAEIHIGNHVLIGPNVQLYTATHPMDYPTRVSGLELGKPIRIGSGCWLGGNVIVNPGVTIGDRSVIGSGSVVTKDIPPGVFAAGNPCKVIKQLEN